MGQEFIIKSQQIEDKINQLLPSQGGFQPGVDFSASTTVIPIVDLTETAEGSNLRQDLQTSLSFTSVTAFSVTNTSTTIINTTGYYRIFGNFNGTATGGTNTANISIGNGFSSKILRNFTLAPVTTATPQIEDFDFIVLLQAGDSIIATSNSTNVIINGVTRQIADLSGNLINP